VTPGEIFPNVEDLVAEFDTLEDDGS